MGRVIMAKLRLYGRGKAILTSARTRAAPRQSRSPALQTGPCWSILLHRTGIL